METQPTTINTLRALGREIQKYQHERALSDAQLFRKISQIGSTKTYKAILDPDDSLDDYNLERQLKNFQAAVAYMQTLRKDDLPPEPEYDTFTNIVTSLAAVERAMTEPGLARLVIIEGETATGKDAVKNALCAHYKDTAVVAQANPLWQDNSENPWAVKTMLAGLVACLDIRRRKDKEGKKFVMPVRPDGLLALLKEELNKSKTLLIINEAHHFGARGLNLIKDIINDTPVVIVILCIPRLLSRIVNTHYEEASQLTGNRLSEHVVLPAPPKEEIAELFEKRNLRFADESFAEAAAKRIADEAPKYGNWRFVSMVARECFMRHRAAPMSHTQFTNALSLVCSRRTNQRPQ